MECLKNRILRGFYISQNGKVSLFFNLSKIIYEFSLGSGFGALTKSISDRNVNLVESSILGKIEKRSKRVKKCKDFLNKVNQFG